MPKAKADLPVDAPRLVPYQCTKGHRWASTTRWKVRVGDGGELHICPHCAFLAYQKLFANCGTVTEVKDVPA